MRLSAYSPCSRLQSVQVLSAGLMAGAAVSRLGLDQHRPAAPWIQTGASRKPPPTGAECHRGSAARGGISSDGRGISSGGGRRGSWRDQQ